MAGLAVPAQQPPSATGVNPHAWPSTREALPVFLIASKKWDDLSPREREEIKRRKERYDALSEQEKRRIREAKDRYQKLPSEEQKRIRERWDKMSPKEKDKYRLEKRNRPVNPSSQ